MAQASRLQAATFLAAQGWRVFPLHWPKNGRCSCGKQKCSIGKHPISTNWQAEATTDLDKITTWWTKTPEANIGLATGEASNLIVLDIDGANGEATVSAKGHEKTITVITGKGRQLYFKYPGERVRNKVGSFPELDSRGDGGYVVAPGSLHQSGKLYHFEPSSRPPDTKLVDAPRWWLTIVLESAASKPKDSGKAGEPTKKVIKGGRNSALASMAGVLRDRGLSVDTILVALKDYNKTYCSPPLEDEEVEGVAQSYGRYDVGDPTKKYKISELTNMIRNDRHFLATPIDIGGCGVKLLVYQAGVFQPSGADVARRMADKILGNASRPDTINSVVDLVRERVKINEDFLNPRAMELVNVGNGMLDWRSGKLHDHSPDHLSTYQLSASYDQEAKSEALDKFMKAVFPDDSLPLVDEIIGYLAIPSTKYQKAVMLVGEGANGKSTFLHVLSHFLQELNVSRMSLHQLEDSPFSAAELQGKLANIYADIPNSRLEKSDTFKSIVAGDPIKAERKFGHPFTLKTTARLIFSANAFPKSSDSSEAYFRRWIIIPFPNKFEGAKADPELVKKLTGPTVMSALLNRALTGLRRLEDNQGFSLSKSTESQSEAYRTENNSSYEFMREKLKEGDLTKKISKADLYAKYLGWCEENGVKFPSNNRQLNHTIERNMTGAKVILDGPKRTKCWSGIEVVDTGSHVEDKY